MLFNIFFPLRTHVFQEGKLDYLTSQPMTLDAMYVFKALQQR